MKKIIMAIPLISLLSVSAMAVEWEIGIGSNYGGLLGITANQKITKDIELYGGVALLGGVAGARYYFNDNIRLNLNYGVNGFNYIEGDEWYSGNLDLYHGFNLGMDYMWDNGFTFGIMTALTENGTNYTYPSDDELSANYSFDDDYSPNLQFSFGYRF